MTYINFTHALFVSSIVVFNGSTALRMRAQHSYLSHGYDDGIPVQLPGDTTLFLAVARNAYTYRTGEYDVSVDNNNI